MGFKVCLRRTGVWVVCGGCNVGLRVFGHLYCVLLGFVVLVFGGVCVLGSGLSTWG